MTITVRRAVASEAKPLVGIYGESGSGKTYSSLLLACGYCDGDMSKVVMIESESGRGEVWADDPLLGGYNVAPMRQDFSPIAYGEAIAAAEALQPRALIIDSASHEWEGIGGVLDMADKNKAAGKKGVQVWQKPKMDHAREFMLRFQQGPTPLVVLCMRARYAMEEVTAEALEKWDRPGKRPSAGDWVRGRGLTPKQADDILSDMFVHGWLDQEEHRFHVTKDTHPAMLEVFTNGEPITLDTGKRLAGWSAGTLFKFLTEAQQQEIAAECLATAMPLADFLARAKVPSLERMPMGRFPGAIEWLRKQPRKPVDEGAILVSIDHAKDEEAAALILDGTRSNAALHARAAEAFKNRWKNASAGASSGQ